MASRPCGSDVLSCIRVLYDRQADVARTLLAGGRIVVRAEFRMRDRLAVQR